MNSIGFILGRERELSLAEINAVFEREQLSFEVEFLSKDVVVVSSAEDISAISINLFGGIIKTFDIIAFGPHRNELMSILSNFQPAQTEKRVNFGISGYGNISQKEIFNLGKKLKEHFSEQEIGSRFVTGKYKDLTSVIVHENKLIERGFEAILVETNGRFIVGRTKEVQDYKSYSKFDYGRPYRDDKAGMIPPKLAQIMINLSKAKTDSVLYDPFCGSGTIVDQAVVMGFKNVFGSDISDKAVDDSKANLRWIEQNFDTKTVPKENLFVSDILNPTKEIMADSIIAEGFLGEPIRRNKEQAITDAKVLASFYNKALSNLEKMLKPNGRIILAIPFFIVGNESIYLPISNLPLVKVNPVEKFDIKLSARGNLTYSRKDQFVGREILILEKN